MALPYEVNNEDGTPKFTFPAGRVRMGRTPGDKFSTGTADGVKIISGLTPGNCWIATRRESLGGNQPVIYVESGQIRWAFKDKPTAWPNAAVEIEYGFV